MSVSFSPIGPWPLVVLSALGVMLLTAWAYRARMRGTSGRWRWLALGLRLAAVSLCVIAALRPSVLILQKKDQPASLIFLIDSSSSMSITDEVGAQSRSGVALKTLARARAALKELPPMLDVKFYRFDSQLRDYKPDDPTPANGPASAVGTAMTESFLRQSGKRIATMFILSDGANNEGSPPLDAARRLRGQQVPVVTVGFGSEAAGPGSRDIAMRELITSPTVFVKNKLQVRGSLSVRGFANQPLDVELYVEGQTAPVAKIQVKAPEGQQVVPFSGLVYSPQTTGEKRITLRVKPKDGELVQANNAVSTYVRVLSGGLNVRYIQGPSSPWEFKFTGRAIVKSPDIQADMNILRRESQGDRGELADDEFTPLRYDVYILGDLHARFLTRQQHRLLTQAVEKGAGLIMLGGESSFGAGGWASTELARVLPTSIHPGDGQLEPEAGLKFVPMPTALDGYLLQVGANPAASQKIWDALPPLSGTNRFGEAKAGANILARAGSTRGEPIMIGGDNGKSRVLAFGGETWVWARASDEGRAAHRRFWRQVIFWLAHKEDQGENQIKVALDRRRIAVGQKVDVTVTARDAKNAPIPDAVVETKVTRKGAEGSPVTLETYAQGSERRGSFYETGIPGEYTVSVTATRNGQALGRDSARFEVYQDDREQENPAADRALLRQIAEITGGRSLAPEKLQDYLEALDGTTYTQSESQTEHRIWDNWPFFLVFTTLLTLEWWLRKRHGWV